MNVEGGVKVEEVQHLLAGLVRMRLSTGGERFSVGVPSQDCSTQASYEPPK